MSTVKSTSSTMLTFQRYILKVQYRLNMKWNQLKLCWKTLQDDTLRLVLVVMVTVFIVYGFVIRHGFHVHNMKNKKNPVPARFHNGLTNISKRRSSNCDKYFASSYDENLEVIKTYPKGDSGRYISRISGNKTKPDNMASFPVFVTAMDFRYYPFSQGMFMSLHLVLDAPRNKGKSRLIVYDLGLSGRQLKVLHKKCKCEIRRFPFEEFPPHVRNLKTYAFKPIIIQLALLEFGFVWWVDISVKLLHTNLDSAINYAKENSMLFFVERTNPKRVSIAKQTDVRTFNYLEEDICKYRSFGEVWATTVMFHYDNISKAVVSAWTSCALEEACIAPVGDDKLKCDFLDLSDGRCHRFDQSVLGIIVRRLYHEQNEYPLDKKLNDLYYIGRREFVNYFERCRFEFTCY